MRPSARTRANRRNAKLSTGPKTRAGKARVARNAYKHGLSIPAGIIPAYAPAVKIYLEQIIDDTASEAVISAATVVAEALVEIDRVREIRLLLYKYPSIRVNPPTNWQIFKSIVAQHKYLDSLCDVDEETGKISFADITLEEVRERLVLLSCNINSVNPEASEFAVGSMLLRLWRYEVRALRQRDRAAARLLALKQVNEENPSELIASKISQVR